MKYCPECGTGHDCTISSGPAPEVEIARINAKRDVEVAKIERGNLRAELETEETIAEIEAIADVEEAEAVAETIGTMLAEPAGDPEPPPDVEPVVVVHEEPEPDIPPPPAGEPRPPKPPKNPGWWDSYR